MRTSLRLGFSYFDGESAAYFAGGEVQTAMIELAGELEFAAQLPVLDELLSLGVATRVSRILETINPRGDEHKTHVYLGVSVGPVIRARSSPCGTSGRSKRSIASIFCSRRASWSRRLAGATAPGCRSRSISDRRDHGNGHSIIAPRIVGWRQFVCTACGHRQMRNSGLCLFPFPSLQSWSWPNWI